MAKAETIKVTIDDEKIKERMQEFLAQAWDQGYNQAGWDFIGSDEIDPQDIPSRRNERNPYRDLAATL